MAGVGVGSFMHGSHIGIPEYLVHFKVLLLKNTVLITDSDSD